MSKSKKTGEIPPEKPAATILLVDDNPVLLKAYGAALKRRGYAVKIAQDGLEAMKLVATIKPSLVVLDLLMPKVEGKYVLKYIRSQPGLDSLRVIVLSDASRADDGEEALGMRPDAIFLKSQCTVPLLVKTVKELLGPAGPAAPTPPA